MSRNNKTKEEKNFYIELGHNLSLARQAAGRSQAEAAEYADVSFQQFQKWEKGKNRIPVRELAMLASYLGTPLPELLGLEDLQPSRSPLRRLVDDVPEKEFLDVLKAWSTIRDRRMKTAVVRFINALAAID